jgi:hypothetical protein
MDTVSLAAGAGESYDIVFDLHLGTIRPIDVAFRDLDEGRGSDEAGYCHLN